jgi:hypothetical protein
MSATQTIDAWDRASENQAAHLTRQEALVEHAAHCSTQHNNERPVKLGALMASTGKTKILAGVFAIASNNFMTESRNFSEADPTRKKRGGTNKTEAREPPGKEKDVGLGPNCEIEGNSDVGSCTKAGFNRLFKST